MTETPEPRTEPTTVATSPAADRPSRLTVVALWIAIVAGTVFIIAIIFFSGFALGARTGGGYHHWHGGGHHEGGMGWHHHPRMGPGGPGGPGGGQWGPWGPGGPGGGPGGPGGPGAGPGGPGGPTTLPTPPTTTTHP
jgi:hypothetical protein